MVPTFYGVVVLSVAKPKRSKREVGMEIKTPTSNRLGEINP